MLFHDPHALNRNSFTGEPDAPHDQWNEWDFALAESRQLIEDYTDKHGHLIFERDSDEVAVDAIKKVDKAQAAIDKKTSGKKYKAGPGEYFVTELWLARGKEWPTLKSWMEQEQKKRGEPSG